MRGFVGVIFVCGCFHPTPPEEVACSTPGQACPNGQVCDMNRNVCVSSLPADGAVQATIDAPAIECNANTPCPAATPVCSTSDTCRGCERDSECASDVCSESTGACIDETAALYVAPTGADNTCTRTAPCATAGFALTLASATRHSIKIADGSYSDSFIVQTLTFPILISGEGNPGTAATLTFNDDGGTYDHVIEVRGVSVVVEGLTLTGAKAEGVRAQANATLTLFAVEIEDSGQGGLDIAASTVHVLQSRIDHNPSEAGIVIDGGLLDVERSAITHNVGGGIEVKAGTSYTIINSFITKNGGSSSTIGGIDIEDATIPSAAQIELDTVADNVAAAALPGAVQCATGVTLRNSIFVNNGNAQVSALCAVDHSLFSDAEDNGGQNLVGDPLFVDPMMGDYHIGLGSPAIDTGLTSTITIDYDGDSRPQGVTWDMGADEYRAGSTN